MQRVLISAWTGMGNLGDDCLADRFRAGLNADVGWLLEPQARSRKDEADAVIRWPALSQRSPKALSAFRELVRGYDSLVFAGGGWLAGDQGSRSPARWAVRTRLVDIPLHGFAMGVGPFPTRSGRLLGRATLARLDHMSVRTSSDVAWASSLVGGLQPQVVGDPALLTDDVPAQHVKRHGVVIAMPKPAAHWWPGSSELYRSRVMSLAKHLAMPGEAVSFVHFQQGPGGDSWFWEGVDWSGPEGYVDAAQRLTSARVVVAGRLHAAILAGLAGTSVVPLSYHHKFSLLESLGLEPQPMSLVLEGTQTPRAQQADPGQVLRARSSTVQGMRALREAVLT